MHFGYTWVNANNSDSNELKNFLHCKNDSLLQGTLFYSETNKQLSQSLNNEQTETDFTSNDNDQDDSASSKGNIVLASSLTNNYPKNLNWNSQNAQFKRAFDLCGSNIEAQHHLYVHITQFIHSEEINHSDNMAVMKKRYHDYDKEGNSSQKNVSTIISSNKIVNTYSRSTKRTKSSYEK